MRIVQPPGWKRPRGYSNAIAAKGETIFIAGQIGWDAQERFVSGGFAEQAAQALRNIVALLNAAGAAPEHLTRMTWYVIDKRAYLAAGPALGRAYREIVGEHYPAMTLVQVAALLEDRALVEIEATAVLPAPG